MVVQIKGSKRFHLAPHTDPDDVLELTSLIEDEAKLTVSIVDSAVAFYTVVTENTKQTSFFAWFVYFARFAF